MRHEPGTEYVIHDAAGNVTERYRRCTRCDRKLGDVVEDDCRGGCGLLTMHLEIRDLHGPHAYWLTCSCGARSPEKEATGCDPEKIWADFLADDWGKEHR